MEDGGVFVVVAPPNILHERSTPEGQRHIAVDGKALRLCFDNFCGRKAAHILSVFTSDPALMLAHLDCDEKSSEIPAVQALLRQLGLEQALLTVDAMRRQKNLRGGRCRADRPGQGQPAHVAPTRGTCVPDHSRRRPKRDQQRQAAIA
jgi:hypothetical protein